ncbi:MAG: thioredoxin domain-containing protein [Alphaproteobacteria bacterium]
MNISLGKTIAIAIISAGLGAAATAAVLKQPPAAATEKVVAAPATAPASLDVEKAMADRAIGKDDAPITIIEYASLTCDHCAAFHANALPEVKKQLIDTGKARLIFRDMPWDQYALRAGKMARCAPEDKYFDMIGTLFEKQKDWARSTDPARGITDIGIAAGMDEKYLATCFGSDALDTAMAGKAQEGRQKFGVNSTPTFIFMKGDERLTEFPEFQEIFDRLGKHDHNHDHPH